MSKPRKKGKKKAAAAPKSNHVPVEILNKRVRKLNTVLKHRKGGHPL